VLREVVRGCDHGLVTSSRAALAAGAVAGVVGLATAELASALLRVRVTPVEAVGEAVIELTPAGLAERAIEAVGQWDKPLLVAGVVVGLLCLSALAGLLGRSRRSLGSAFLVLLTAVGVVAALTRDDAGALAFVAPAVGGAAALAALTALLVRLPSEPAGRSDAEQVEAGGTGRRAFLQWSLTLVATSAVLGGASVLFGRARRRVDAARDALSLGLRRTVVPAGVDLDVPGVQPWLTAEPDFYRIDTSLAPPLLRPQEWELRIHGMVRREVRITYDQLVERGLQDAWITLCCVSNEVGGDLISNALWSGIPVADLLAEAGVDAGADAVLQTSSDGWTCGTPLAALTDGRNALLAVAMNGEPLSVEHGFPVRVVVPGLYGYVSATKWVVDWEVTRFADFDAYWTQRGWAELGPVKTQSRIDTPRSGSEVTAGTVRVGGVAWAQHTGIDRVEVRVDDGEWSAATLGADPSIDTWVQWLWEWEATAGEHTLAVRATDRRGETQTSEREGTVPDGATGWHTVRVRVD
jgi:DMSO/TMAO reductase YedYZ molybdopterin-dependent catalytic subunit